LGQESNSPDIPLLEHAGFEVVTGSNYEGLFQMLESGRFDLFARSVVDASIELQHYQKKYPDLMVEHRILLYYPSVHYIFVARTPIGEKIAKRIEMGFEMMLKDGSFETFFKQYKAPFEETLKLSTRERFFALDNPNLPPETPLLRKALWFNPFEGE
jgi:ABC-type amino acid transport substrate-binding protein